MTNLLKTVVLSLITVLFTASITLAGMNLRQNDDGTADFMGNDSDGAEHAYPIGQYHLSMTVSGIAAVENTFAMAVPVTFSKLVRVLVTLQGDISTANSVLNFYRSESSTGTMSNKITDGTATTGLNLVQGGDDETGQVFTFTPSGDDRTFQRGWTVLVHTDGGATSAGETNIAAQFVFTFEPADAWD